MKNILFLLLLFINSSTSAQTELWNLKVSKDGFMSQLEDGKIFIKDKNKISLVDNLTGELEWENKVKTEKDPRFLDGVPFMYFEGKNFALIDASSGDMIDQSEEKTEVLNVHYEWDKGRIIMELDRDKKLRILNLDLNDISKSWNTEVGKVQKSMFGLAKRGTENAPSLAKDGTMVLADKKFVSFLSADGVVKERIEFKKDIKKEGYNSENDILYVLEDKKKLHFIDVNSGKTNATVELKEKDLQLEVLDGGAAVAVVQKKECLLFDSVTGEEKARYKGKEEIKDVLLDEETGKYYLLSKKLVAELNTSEGTLIKQAELDHGFTDLKSVDGKVFLSGRGKANELDLAQFKQRYAKSPTIPPVHSFIELDGDYTLLTYQTVRSFSVTVLDTNGEKVWDQEYVTITTPTIDIIKDGVLIIDDKGAKYLSIKTGKSKWKKGIKSGPAFAYAFDRASEELIFYGDKKVHVMDTKTGRLKTSQEKFKFKDFDYETQTPQVLAVGDNVFLKGSNSIYVTDRNGKLIHEKHYKKSDNTSGLLKWANAAVTVAAIGSGNADKVITVYSDGQQIHKGGMVDGLNDTWAYANNAAAARQAKQNKSSNAYPYVFTKLTSGKRGIILIDPETGEERFELKMDESSPNYIVDDVDGIVFYLSKSQIQALDIK